MSVATALHTLSTTDDKNNLHATYLCKSSTNICCQLKNSSDWKNLLNNEQTDRRMNEPMNQLIDRWIDKPKNKKQINESIKQKTRHTAVQPEIFCQNASTICGTEINNASDDQPQNCTNQERFGHDDNDSSIGKETQHCQRHHQVNMNSAQRRSAKNTKHRYQTIGTIDKCQTSCHRVDYTGVYTDCIYFSFLFNWDTFNVHHRLGQILQSLPNNINEGFRTWQTLNTVITSTKLLFFSSQNTTTDYVSTKTSSKTRS